MSITSRILEVRFQEVKAFAIRVEAKNAQEADVVALALFKSRPEIARLLRTDHGFLTIEDLGEDLTTPPAIRKIIMSMNEAQLKNALKQFTGTENWYQHSLFRTYKYTDGIQYLAEEAGAYWLVDLIFGLQFEHKAIRETEFQSWTLKVEGSRAELLCSDGDYTPIHKQTIQFTDFPMKEVRFYLIDHVLLLLSEY